ncbi:hypothetical protein CPLU01_12219 [Colletotrichum plurivorum]|uniref:Peroxin 20 n=1 Tax=Colletotrichum plurivorum TaxID=2175906 RepID=A0A8H6K0M8_9PEZI|nr:hypothetical protein CPLU01_12219 [Colletotrichum plurivorum]
MGDSSCSGSTPLKSFVDHGAQDRSLHQDRTSAALGSQHGFRSNFSAPRPQAQQAFGAFMNGNGTGLTVPNVHAGLHLSHLAHHERQIFPAGSLESTSPVPATAAPALPAQVRQPSHGSSESTNWAQDFAKYCHAAPDITNKNAGAFSTAQQCYPRSSIGLAHNMSVFHPSPSGLGPVAGPVAGPLPLTVHGAARNYAVAAESEFDSEMDRWMAAHGGPQVENVDAIMEELARELEQQSVVEEPQKAKFSTRNGSISSRNASLEVNHDSKQGTSNIATHGQEASLSGRTHSVTFHDATVSSSDVANSDVFVGADDEAAVVSAVQHPEQRPSDISEAARLILESVQHEQGDKWRNSRFLLLMRDFRDGNKDIVENEILETRVNGDRAGEQAAIAES